MARNEAMPEYRTPKRVRIQSDGDPLETIITDVDGGELPPITSAVWRCEAGGRATVALEFFAAELDVIADVATLERLAKAEAAVREAERLLRTAAQLEHVSEIAPGAPLRVHPLRPQVFALWRALNEWRTATDQAPLPHLLGGGGNAGDRDGEPTPAGTEALPIRVHMPPGVTEADLTAQVQEMVRKLEGADGVETWMRNL